MHNGGVSKRTLTLRCDTETESKPNRRAADSVLCCVCVCVCVPMPIQSDDAAHASSWGEGYLQ